MLFYFIKKQIKKWIIFSLIRLVLQRETKGKLCELSVLAGVTITNKSQRGFQGVHILGNPLRSRKGGVMPGSTGRRKGISGWQRELWESSAFPRRGDSDQLKSDLSSYQRNGHWSQQTVWSCSQDPEIQRHTITKRCITIKETQTEKAKCSWWISGLLCVI